MNRRQTGLMGCVAAAACLTFAPCTPAAEIFLRGAVFIPNSTLDQNSAVMSFGELSGVTYDSSADRFWAVNDGSNKLVQLNVQFNADGSIQNAAVVSGLRMAESRDFEGIAFTSAARNSVFVSEEDTPGVREYSLTDGSHLQTLTTPAVFTAPGHLVGNRGFEALARHPDGSVMYAAVEEALTVDGPTATTTQPTVVRVQRYDVTGNDAAPGAQYAYVVDPIHAGPGGQSGLSDLLVLPNGTVLALERSWAGGLNFRTRIYALDFSAATDISQGAAADGLIGQAYTPIAKGQPLLEANLLNLEGLALGPQLPNGHYVLLGVVDANQAGPNIITSFELVIPEPATGVVGAAAAPLLLRRQTKP